jgi:hypothetical protein
MFLDMSLPGGGGEPWKPSCKSCHGPIGANDSVEHIKFEVPSDHRLQDLNGTYHAECARPILSVKRAYDMLGRFGH